jgi:hypothetical protein
VSTRRRDEPAFPTSPAALQMRAEITADPNIVAGGFTLFERTVVDLVGAILGALEQDDLIKEGVQDRAVKTAISLAARTWDELEVSKHPVEKGMDELAAGSYLVEIDRRDFK